MTVDHRISRCPYCREFFGTAEALKLHKPKPVDKRSRQLKQTGQVKRSLCASEKTMLRAGAWRGFGGIWWTVEHGAEEDEIYTAQDFENNVVILDKIATPDSAIPENEESHNHAGFGAAVSKLRR